MASWKNRIFRSAPPAPTWRNTESTDYFAKLTRELELNITTDRNTNEALLTIDCRSLTGAQKEYYCTMLQHCPGEGYVYISKDGATIEIEAPPLDLGGDADNIADGKAPLAGKIASLISRLQNGVKATPSGEKDIPAMKERLGTKYNENSFSILGAGVVEDGSKWRDSDQKLRTAIPAAIIVDGVETSLSGLKNDGNRISVPDMELALASTAPARETPPEEARKDAIPKRTAIPAPAAGQQDMIILTDYFAKASMADRQALKPTFASPPREALFTVPPQLSTQARKAAEAFTKTGYNAHVENNILTVEIYPRDRHLGPGEANTHRLSFKALMENIIKDINAERAKGVLVDYFAAIVGQGRVDKIAPTYPNPPTQAIFSIPDSDSSKVATVIEAFSHLGYQAAALGNKLTVEIYPKKELLKPEQLKQYRLDFQSLLSDVIVGGIKSQQQSSHQTKDEMQALNNTEDDSPALISKEDAASNIKDATLHNFVTFRPAQDGLSINLYVATKTPGQQSAKNSEVTISTLAKSLKALGFVTTLASASRDGKDVKCVNISLTEGTGKEAVKKKLFHIFLEEKIQEHLPQKQAARG